MRNFLNRRRAISGRPEATDDGMTLVELMVVMAIFSGLLAIVFSVLITVTRDTKHSIAYSDQVEQMRLGLMQIDRQVRSGNVIADPSAETLASSGVASGYSMRVYTQTDGVFQCVQWRVLFEGAATTDGRLEYRSWDPAWRSTGEVRDWGVVGRALARGTDNPATPDRDESLPFQKVASGGASKAQSVSVTLWHKSADTRAQSKPVAVQSVLTGRNTIYGYPSDECSDVPAP